MATKPEVAIAILHQNNTFLMQLRDDIPGIAYPGHWGFFGGHLDPGETPAAAVHRELLEEIGYASPQLDFFCPHGDRTEHSPCLSWPFNGCSFGPAAERRVGFGPCDHRRKFSAANGTQRKPSKKRPMGSPHQQLLLSFLEITPIQTIVADVLK